MKKRVVLITGATSGIGKAAAEFFCEKGYTVYGTGRNVECEKIKENVWYTMTDGEVVEVE